MKVSLITVTFNSAKYLEDSILSVLEQDYTDIEYIVIDGGSTDGTQDIINKYKEHIAFWISEPDGGMYDAINKGMKLASGDIIGTLNSDDMLADTGTISAIVDGFNSQGVDVVYGDLVYVKPDAIDQVVRVWKGRTYNRNRYRFGWMPAHPTFYFKRKLLEKNGYYETHYFTAADYEFMARYLFYFRATAYYVPRLIVKMRAGGMSNGNILRRLRANRRDYLAMQRNRIPFAFFVSWIKPFRKLLQYKKTGGMKILKQSTTLPPQPRIIIKTDTVNLYKDV